MTYSVSLEWNTHRDSAILRVHEGEGKTYGDPYIWSCFVAKEGDVAHFKGAMGAPPFDAINTISAALLAADFTRRRHERYRGGKLVTAISKPLTRQP